MKKDMLFRSLMKDRIKIFLSVLICAFTFFHNVGKAQVNTNKYLTNSWIIVKTAINDTVVKLTNCTNFFHQTGEYGIFCSDANEFQLLGQWSYAEDKLIIRQRENSTQYKILEKTNNSMILESVTKEKRLITYCEWK